MGASGMGICLLGLCCLVVACDDEKETKETKAKTPASATQSADTPKESPSAEPAPKTASGNSVTFKTSRIPYAGFSLVHAEATIRTMGRGTKKYKSLIIDLANYDRQGGAYLPKASKEGHRKVTLNFSAPGDVAVGQYPVDGTLNVSNRLDVGIHAKFHHIGLIKGEGTGEITSIDDKRVQGKVSVSDSQGTTVEATFDIEYTVAK